MGNHRLQPDLLLCLFFFFTFCSSKTHPRDIEALRRLKLSIIPSSIPPSSCLSSWDFTSSSSADPCDSLFSANLFTCGFRCDSNTNTTPSLSLVTDITLDPAGYSGRLSPYIWAFSSLRSLDISDNQISGPIPTIPYSLSLPYLRHVSLSRNELEGEIPAGVFNKDVMLGLEELFLDENSLSGEIPASVSTMKNLRRLELQGNNLTGMLPSDLGELQDLYFLDASDNFLSGPIPPNLPPSLVELSMRNNLIEGEIPPVIGNLGFIQVIDLSQNRLTGSIPSTLFSHRTLQQLVLASNNLSAMAAPAWGGGRRSELVELDLSENDIDGMLPLWVVEMPRLSALSLESNRFTGMIPWVYAAKPLARLMLAGNYLYGPIPSPFTAMKAGSAVISLADNCFFRCPEVFFFCRGGEQKSMDACRAVNPFIP